MCDCFRGHCIRKVAADKHPKWFMNFLSKVLFQAKQHACNSVNDVFILLRDWNLLADCAREITRMLPKCLHLVVRQLEIGCIRDGESLLLLLLPTALTLFRFAVVLSKLLRGHFSNFHVLLLLIVKRS